MRRRRTDGEASWRWRRTAESLRWTERRRQRMPKPSKQRCRLQLTSNRNGTTVAWTGMGAILTGCLCLRATALSEHGTDDDDDSEEELAKGAGEGETDAAGAMKKKRAELKAALSQRARGVGVLGDGQFASSLPSVSDDFGPVLRDCVLSSEKTRVAESVRHGRNQQVSNPHLALTILTSSSPHPRRHLVPRCWLCWLR